MVSSFTEIIYHTLVSSCNLAIVIHHGGNWMISTDSGSCFCLYRLWIILWIIKLLLYISNHRGITYNEENTCSWNPKTQNISGTPSSIELMLPRGNVGRLLTSADCTVRTHRLTALRSQRCQYRSNKKQESEGYTVRIACIPSSPRSHLPFRRLITTSQQPAVFDEQSTCGLRYCLRSNTHTHTYSNVICRFFLPLSTHDSLRWFMQTATVRHWTLSDWSRYHWSMFRVGSH